MGILSSESKMRPPAQRARRSCAQKKMIEALLSAVPWILGTAAALLAGEVLMQRVGWLPKSKSGRYYTLHLATNLAVAAVHAPDVATVFTNPVAAFTGPVDLRGTAMVAVLHLHHVTLYRPLQPVDLMHHVVFCGFVIPLSLLVTRGPLQGFGAFWVCGLPGALDYAALVAVKRGWMTTLTEKRINAFQNTWLRVPGCVAQAVLVWAAYASGAAGSTFVSRSTAGVVCAALAGLFLTNGLYFQNRVVGNLAASEAWRKAAALTAPTPA